MPKQFKTRKQKLQISGEKKESKNQPPDVQKLTNYYLLVFFGASVCSPV